MNIINYDSKDLEIEQQFDEIHQKAIDIFDFQTDILEQVEGKYKARITETASLYLMTALKAIDAKKSIKQQKDKSLTFSVNITRNDFITTIVQNFYK